MLLSLPKCKVGADIDVDYKDDVDGKDKNISVSFVLEHGSDNALCHMNGEVVIEAFDVHQSGDVENGIEIDFKYIKVGETCVSIDRSDFDIEPNQKIELTESQISDLNEKLKNEMVRV